MMIWIQKQNQISGSWISLAPSPWPWHTALNPRPSAPNLKKIKLNSYEVSSVNIFTMAIAIITIISITCSNLIIKTLEEVVNLFKVNNKDTREIVLISVLLILSRFHTLLWCLYCSRQVGKRPLGLPSFHRRLSLLHPIFSWEILFSVNFSWSC